MYHCIKSTFGSFGPFPLAVPSSKFVFTQTHQKRARSVQHMNTLGASLKKKIIDHTHHFMMFVCNKAKKLDMYVYDSKLFARMGFSFGCDVSVFNF